MMRQMLIAGNVVFLLWILYNGINEGFRGTPIEVVSYVSLMLLLLANALLLMRRS